MWCDQVLDKLFPKFSGLVIEDVIDIGGEVVVAARVRSGSAAACTACGADTHHWLAAATSAHLQTMRVICFGRGRECAPWPSWPSRLQGALHALQQVGAPGRVRFWQVAKPRQTCRSDGVADEWKVARIGKFAGTPLVTEEPDRHALLGKDRLGPADTQAVFQRIETSNKARGMVDASGLEESAEALFVPVCW